jgi:hypothetical protein
MASSKGGAWYQDGYTNKASRIEKNTGTEEPYLVELMAVRTWQCLNGCVSLDWNYENCLVGTIRTVAPAFRLAYFLTGVYLIIQSLFFLEWPLVFRYDTFTSNRGRSPGNFTMNICMMLWALDFVFLAAAYHYVRLNSKGGWECFSSVTGYRPARWVAGALYALFFIAAAIIGIISTHTILSHMWHTRNVWFAGLLVFQCVMLVAGALGDAIDTGSPWGIQEASRVASVLLGLRLRVLVPVTVIFSVAAIFASWPPSYCAEC